MSRYIDAEWLLNFFEPYPNDYHTPLGTLRACVNDAPSIEIVFCKDCKYVGGEKCWMRNNIARRFPQDDDFCSYGERRG